MDDREVDRLRQGVRIEDVIRASGLHVTGRGNLLRTEEHDSLALFIRNNTWYWWSRGEGGDVFYWLMYTQRVSYPDAIRMIAGGDYGRPVSLPPAPPKPMPTAATLPPGLHLRYHAALDDGARAWWHGQGINDEAISRFLLGYCAHHSLWDQATYTIPVIRDGACVNIRHRLSDPQKTGDKYRPDRVGLPTEMFNGDVLTPEQGYAIVVAGEKKAVVAWQFGLTAVSSTAGCGHWNDEWTTRLQFCRQVYVCFDPGEGEAAERLAERIGERVWIMELKEKPDDFLLAHGLEEFRKCARQARTHVNRHVWLTRNGGRSAWGKTLERTR